MVLDAQRVAPIRWSLSSATASLTVAALPSTTGSPQPVMPSSVRTRRNSQRGGTRKVSMDTIFMGFPSRRR